MRREERERILKQGVVSAETPTRPAGTRGPRRGRPLRAAPREAPEAPPAELPARRRQLSLRARRAAPVHGAAARDHRDDRRPRAAVGRGADGARGGRDRRRRASRRHGGRGRDVVVRRGQRPDRPPQPVLSRRVPAADGSAHAGPTRSSAARTTSPGRSTSWALERFPAPSASTVEGAAQPAAAPRG